MELYTVIYRINYKAISSKLWKMQREGIDMAIFSRIVEDGTIIEVARDFNNILIITCGGCINESLAYTNKYPIFKEVDGKTIAYAVHLETERISKLLSDNSHAVKVCTSDEIKNSGWKEGFLCMRKKGAKFDLFNHIGNFKPDMILSLCCGAGTFGIIDSYGTKIPVKQITKPFGMLGYVFDYENGEQIMDYSHTKVIGYDKAIVE
jgi:hypothetical protein